MKNASKHIGGEANKKIKPANPFISRFAKPTKKKKQQKEKKNNQVG